MKDAENIKKYIGHDSAWRISMELFMDAERKYSKHIFDIRDDITRRQASDEFWQRISEFYGFKIDFQREIK